MRVEIIKPFEVDGAKGGTRYTPGEIVPNGQRNWIEKGLAVEAPERAKPSKTETPVTPSAETPKS